MGFPKRAKSSFGVPSSWGRCGWSPLVLSWRCRGSVCQPLPPPETKNITEVQFILRRSPSHPSSGEVRVLTVRYITETLFVGEAFRLPQKETGGATPPLRKNITATRGSVTSAKRIYHICQRKIYHTPKVYITSASADISLRRRRPVEGADTQRQGLLFYLFGSINGK